MWTGWLMSAGRMTTFPAGGEYAYSNYFELELGKTKLTRYVFPPTPSCLRTRGTGRSGATRF